MYSIFIFLMAYLFGNISGSMILGKLILNKDIRNYGSNNAGTTNALRVFGLKFGLATFFIDFLKAIFACYIGNLIYGQTGLLIAALAVVIGHNWPVILKFKGGKGIASSFGFICYFDVKIALILTLIFIGIVLCSKYVSLGSIISVLSLIIFMYLFGYRSNDIYYTCLILASMSTFQHRGNIVRILNGTEKKFSVKKS